MIRKTPLTVKYTEPNRFPQNRFTRYQDYTDEKDYLRSGLL